MELCAVNVRQDRGMSHKQPHGCHFSFSFTELCVERRRNVNAKHCFCKMAAKRKPTYLLHQKEKNNSIAYVHSKWDDTVIITKENV